MSNARKRIRAPCPEYRSSASAKKPAEMSV